MMKDQAEKLREIIKQNTEEFKKTGSAKIITVTSGKGGVGKTNIAVNLAISFNEKGKRVLVIDADLGLANVEILMGLVPKHNLSDVINGNMIITEIISEGPNGLKFISGGSGISELARVPEDKLKFFAQNLSLLDAMFDIIIIDTGAGISETVMTFIEIASEVLLVTTPDPTAITDAYALLKVLKNEAGDNLPNVKIVVNMVRNMTEARSIFDKLNKVCEKFLGITLDILEYMPMDMLLEKAVKSQVPLLIKYPKSDMAYAIRSVSDKFSDEEKAGDLNDKKGIRSLIANFMKK